MKLRPSLLLLFGFWWNYANGVLRGQCSECMPNNVACLDEVRFIVCYEGQLTNNLSRCPANRVCTSEPGICLLPTDDRRPACYEDNCATCAPPDRAFACVNETTYGFCYGDTEPNPATITSCPEGYVCSVEGANVCVSVEAGGIPSCIPEDDGDGTTTTEVVTTTTDDVSTDPVPTDAPTQGPPISANVFCAGLQATGNFKPNDDLTCKEYIYCYLLSGQYLGERYICQYYFNAVTRRCQTERPNDC